MPMPITEPYLPTIRTNQDATLLCIRVVLVAQQEAQCTKNVKEQPNNEASNKFARSYERSVRGQRGFDTYEREQPQSPLGVRPFLQLHPSVRQ